MRSAGRAMSEDYSFKVKGLRERLGLTQTEMAERVAVYKETPISTEAMLPGGPYDLWRDTDQSRHVKDLVGAFAENLKLPKMLNRKQILETIDQGVRDGVFVASLPRPDKSRRIISDCG